MLHPLNMNWRVSQQTESGPGNSEPVRAKTTVGRGGRFEQNGPYPKNNLPQSRLDTPSMVSQPLRPPQTSENSDTFDIQEGQSVASVGMTPTNTRIRIEQSLLLDRHDDQADTMFFQSSYLRQSLAAGYAAVDRRQRRGQGHASPTLINVGPGRLRMARAASDG